MKLIAVARVPFAALAAFFTLSCAQSHKDGAKDYFSASNSCPAERVEVRARPELHKSDFARKNDPPADVASDPARLKMWREQDEKNRKMFDNIGELFEARGCGKQAFLECQDTQTMKATCSEETDVPASITKW